MGCQSHDMRLSGRIVGVRSTEQSCWHPAQAKKSKSRRKLACRRRFDFLTRPDRSIKVGCQSHDMRLSGRIVGVRSTEQSCWHPAQAKKSKSRRKLACRRRFDFLTRPDRSIKVGCQSHDMRLSGRIVGVRSTEQSCWHPAQGHRKNINNRTKKYSISFPGNPAKWRSNS